MFRRELSIGLRRWRRYQSTLIQLQQSSGLGMEQLAQLATEEMLDNYITTKCGARALRTRALGRELNCYVPNPGLEAPVATCPKRPKRPPRSAADGRCAAHMRP